MQYTITRRETGWMEAEVTVPLLEVQTRHNALIKHYQTKNLKIPAPALLKKQVHELAARQAARYVCEQERKINWETPEWEVLSSGQDLKLRVSMEVLPEVTLQGHKELVVEVPPVPIPTEGVLISRTLDQQYALAEVEEVDRPIQLGDRVLMDLLTWHEDSLLPMASKANFEYMVYQGTFAPGFAEELIGLAAGDEAQIKSTLDDNFHLENYRGQSVLYDVRIHKVFAQTLPPVDELPDLLGFDDVDQMMEHLYQEKLQENQEKWLKLVRKHLLLRVANSSEFDMPQTLLEAEMISRWEQREAPELEKQGLEEAEQDEALERWLAEPALQEEIYQDLACNLVVRALAHQENIDLSPTDILWALKPFLDTFEMEAEELVQEMRRSGQLGPFCDRLVAEMVMDTLYDRAQLVCDGEIIKDHYEDTEADVSQTSATSVS